MSEANEANRDAAKQALDISRRKLAAGELDAALRFCSKSISLFSTSTAIALLKELQALKKEGNSSASTSNARNGSGPSTPNSEKTRPILKANGKAAAEAAPKPREYTAEQAAVVKRICTCKITDYYEILSVQKDAEEVHIKKAYRKLALTLHPDKNGAPGASDAFKMVSKAFQVLSDPQKRAIHDSHGADPDDRTAGMSRSPFSSSRGGGSMYSDEVSPEELFNMFFGGGMGGQGMRFGGSPFGGSGVRFSSFGGPQMRRTQRQPNNPNAPQQPAWIQLLPLILLVAFSLLTQLPSLFSTQPIPEPSVGFERTAFFDLHRKTHGHLKADYFVNSRQYGNHPYFANLVASNPAKLAPPVAPAGDSAETSSTMTADSPSGKEATSHSQQQHALAYPVLPEGLQIPREYLRFEQNVEQSYLQRLQHICQVEMQDRNERLQRARGFLGLGADWDEVKKQQDRRLEGCEKLRSHGYRIS